MGTLDTEEVRAALGDLPGWEAGEGEIRKRFELADFRAAVAFVVRIAFEAEAADHHPDLDIRYRRVTVVLSTHSEGGVTAKDLALARAIEALA
ncbi:MAG: 4a-hydroxytetrahydrobiopterin dehydratase [Actinomycetota bacterium]|nr:4a-hydroxytetrahydrobiopterin dehydratase [Actinomycetota bacterium]